MRHRVADKKFNRDANQRKGLFYGLLRNLTERGAIVTTLPKAKVLKGLMDRAVSQAKDSSIASRRLLHKEFGDRQVVNILVERVAPAMTDRNSGYTTLEKLGNRRGDNTPMAKIAFSKAPLAAKAKEVKPKVEKAKVDAKAKSAETRAKNKAEKVTEAKEVKPAKAKVAKAKVKSE